MVGLDYSALDHTMLGVIQHMSNEDNWSVFTIIITPRLLDPSSSSSITKEQFTALLAIALLH